MNKIYNILLNGLLIGTTELEKADAPMGVAFGLIEFDGIESPYEFFKEYCLNKQIELASDYPEDKMISTMSIPELKIRAHLKISHHRYTFHFKRLYKHLH